MNGTSIFEQMLATGSLLPTGYRRLMQSLAGGENVELLVLPTNEDDAVEVVANSDSTCYLTHWALDPRQAVKRAVVANKNFVADVLSDQQLYVLLEDDDCLRILLRTHGFDVLRTKDLTPQAAEILWEEREHLSSAGAWKAVHRGKHLGGMAVAVLLDRGVDAREIASIRNPTDSGTDVVYAQAASYMDHMPKVLTGIAGTGARPITGAERALSRGYLEYVSAAKNSNRGPALAYMTTKTLKDEDLPYVLSWLENDTDIGDVWGVLSKPGNWSMDTRVACAQAVLKHGTGVAPGLSVAVADLALYKKLNSKSQLKFVQSCTMPEQCTALTKHPELLDEATARWLLQDERVRASLPNYVQRNSDFWWNTPWLVEILELCSSQFLPLGELPGSWAGSRGQESRVKIAVLAAGAQSVMGAQVPPGFWDLFYQLAAHWDGGFKDLVDTARHSLM